MHSIGWIGPFSHWRPLWCPPPPPPHSTSTHRCASWCVLGAATVWRTPSRIFCKRKATCESWCAFWEPPGSRTPSRSIYNWRISSPGRRSAAACASAVQSTWSRTCCTARIGTSLPPPREGPWVWGASARPRRSSGSRSRCGLWRRRRRATMGIRRWGRGHWGAETAASCW